MNLHELIDREDPRCLYCNSGCDLTMKGMPLGTWSPNSNSYERQILTCRKCKEEFEIHWYDHSGDITYHAFTFTCKGISCFYMYGRDDVTLESLWVINDSVDWSDAINFQSKNRIPFFPIDFSNKNKLYKKLKTYLIFS